MIEKSQESVNGILELFEESDSATYEVAGQLIKSVADTTDKLIDLQKKMKDIDEEPKEVLPITNACLLVLLRTSKSFQQQKIGC